MKYGRVGRRATGDADPGNGHFVHLYVIRCKLDESSKLHRTTYKSTNAAYTVDPYKSLHDKFLFSALAITIVR
jgi:hypothetical protein